MDAKLYQQVKDIINQIWDSPDCDREQLLQQLCGNNKLLKQNVEKFINENVGDDFLVNSPIEVIEISIEEQKNQVLGNKIGRIKVDRLIACGGMGEVYAGVDEVLKREVAIKIMNAGMRLSAQRRQAFLNEAQVLSNLQHPNICKIYDFFVDNDRDVLVLELINGKTLRRIMDAGEIKNPIEIATQIIAALTTAHERGIIHRDLKPDNIMLTEQGVVKILDFGLARSGIDINTLGHPYYFT